MNEQQSIRLDFLSKSKSVDNAVFRTLDEVSQRLQKDWSAAEEEALEKRHPHYCHVSQEIKDIQSKWDSDSLTAPLKAVEQDPEYRAAREAIADQVHELQRRIAPS